MKKLLFFVCAIFAFAACTQIIIEEQQGVNVDTPETLTVGFEDGDQTRIQLNEARKTVWTKNDLVSVFYKSNANQKWEYRGETGEQVAELYRVDAGTASRDMDYVVMAYPYSADYAISTTTGNIEATLSATQSYAKDSYGVGSNLMVSQSEFTQFSLKSVCGWLKLQLTGNGEVVKSIKFRGNNEEQVAGLIHVDTATAEATLASEMGDADDNNAGGNLVFDDTILTELTLDCGEGVTLGEEVTNFYLSLPPQTFANGFTVDIESDGYEILTLSTTNELVIERNVIQPMASLEAEFVKIVYKPASHEIFYTNGSTTEPTTPWETAVFGAKIVSNVYDAKKECWVITFDSDVTYIGECAFCCCDSLTSITIPDSIRWIEKGAFEGCNSLKSFSSKFASQDGRCLIDDGTLIAFASAELTEYTIPDSVTTIGECAFGSCSSVTSVIIPDSVTSIGELAFSYFKTLTSITIPDSITTIGGRAFEGCSGLTSVTIGKGVTGIKYNTFEGCRNLTDITIPDSVTYIGERVFRDCSNLTNITIPDSVTSIGSEAFRGCSSLTSITIPDSVTSINSWAFVDCSSLTSVYCKAKTPPTVSGIFSNNNTSVITVYVPAESISAYRSASYWKDCADINVIIVAYDFEKGEVVPETSESTNTQIWYTNGSTTKSTKPYKTDAFGANIVSNLYDSDKECWVIQFDNDVTTIGNSAFRECSITSITIPDSVTSIGSSAFNRCSTLTSITIPDSVTSIGESAFYGCSSLTSITIGKGVKAIGYSAFSDCTGELIVNCNIPSVDSSSGVFASSKFTSVTIGEGVTTIGKSAFYGCSSITNVTISDSVTTIGKSAFSGCSSLTSVTIPDNVTLIGGWAFNGCSSLTSVTMGNGVTSIDESAFSGCSGLTSVNITNLPAWCKIDFKEMNSNPLYYAENLYLNNELVTELVITSDITEIKSYSFSCYSSLTSVTIPESVTFIGTYAFYCSNLTSVYCKSTTPPTVGGSYMFSPYVSDLKIYVPTNSVSTYKSAPYWVSYKSKIVGYDF